MIVKKEFALYEYLEEEAYLNEKSEEGHCLKKALGDGFEFESCESTKNKYKVMYSLSDFVVQDYPGFSLVDTYSSSKGGYYHYLLEEDEDSVLMINEDRNYSLNNDLGRIERFSGIVISSLMILFLYLYYTQRNPLYLIIVVLAIGLGVFVLNIRAKMKAAITK